jgi:hypothetical protein
MSANDVRSERPVEEPRAWQRPAFEVICLACEISAYAPDEGEPLF